MPIISKNLAQQSTSMMQSISLSKSRANGFEFRRNTSSSLGLSQVKNQAKKQPHKSSFSLVRKNSCSSDPQAKKAINGVASKGSFNKRNIASDTCLFTQGKKIQTIVSTNQKNESWDNSMSPMEVLKACLKAQGKDSKINSSIETQDYFIENTEENIASYSQDVITAIRDQNLDALQTFHSQGRTLQSCNRFGESLIHMACRRGFNDVVYFLVKEAGVSIKVRDDYGRTPMHDACWAASPNFDLMEMLLDEEPSMILLCDKRGHTPLHYVRTEHWDMWVQFLIKRYKIK